MDGIGRTLTSVDRNPEVTRCLEQTDATIKDLPEHDLKSTNNDSYTNKEQNMVPLNTKKFDIYNLSWMLLKLGLTVKLRFFPRTSL